MNQKNSNRIIYGAVIAVLMAGSMMLAYLFFFHQSVRLDEAQSLWQTSKSPIGMINTVAQDVHVPLYYFILHYWQSYFGNSVQSARFLSLIPFLCIIPAAYFLGKQAYSSSIGIFCAVMIAISPFMNWYGNEIRMYSLFALFVVINQYFFMRIFMDKTNERGEVAWYLWLFYALTLIIGLFTHYFFVFIVITQIAFYLYDRGLFPKHSLGNFIIIYVITAVLVLPWLYYVYHLGSAQNTQPQLVQPTSIDVFNTFSQFLFGFQRDAINTIVLSVWPLTVLFLFLALRRSYKLTPQTTYLIMSMALPIIFAFIVSDLWKPIYLSRYLILALPSLYLVIGWLFTAYPVRLGRILKVSLICVMALLLTVEITSADTPVKENFHEASDFLTQEATPQDVIVLSAPFTIYPFEYYYRGPTSVKTLPIWNQHVVGPIPQYSPDEIDADVKELKDSHITLWLLLSYDQGHEEDIRLYFDKNFERILVKKFSQGLNLYAYRLRYDDTSLGTALSQLNHQ